MDGSPPVRCGCATNLGVPPAKSFATRAVWSSAMILDQELETPNLQWLGSQLILQGPQHPNRELYATTRWQFFAR